MGCWRRGEGGGGVKQLGKQLPLIIAEQKSVTYTLFSYDYNNYLQLCFDLGNGYHCKN